MGEIIPLNFFYAALMTIFHGIMMKKIDSIKEGEKSIDDELTKGNVIGFLMLKNKSKK